MRKWMRRLSLGVLFALSVSLAAMAQDMEGLDPLLKILVENKVITLDQARAVQGEYVKQKAKEATVLKEDIGNQVGADIKKSSPGIPDALKGLKVGSTIFFSYQNGNAWSGTKDETTSYDKFVLKRGYINIEKEITPWLSARITPDIYADSAGQYVFRMKYAYANFHWKGNNFFNAPYVEAGIAHTPWVDYEEQVYRYRMVEPTFLDRNSLWGSADAGILGGSNLGPTLSEDYRKNVQSKYAGTWGSWAVGFYNGGGYATSEKNQNKAFEWRLSIRPFGEFVPALTGLQLQWSGVQGLGNKADDNTKHPVVPAPDWKVSQYGLTYESKWVNAEYLYYTGHGNPAGTLYDQASKAQITPAAPTKGDTYFIEGKFPGNRKWSAFYRYDHLDVQTNERYSYKKDKQNYQDIGVAYWLTTRNAIVLDYMTIDHTKPWPGQPANIYDAIPNDRRWQLTYKLDF